MLDSRLPDATVDYEIVPMTRLRRVTGRRLRAAAQDKPHVTLHRYADLTHLLSRIDSEGGANKGSDASGVGTTLTEALIAVLVGVLAVHGRINGRVEEEQIRCYREVNLGVAVAVEDGLIVPVIHRADQLTPQQLTTELRRLVGAARSGALRPEDLADGTFTLTNLGGSGVELFTPIINPPQIAILGVGAVAPWLTLENGSVVQRQRIGLSLSFDHASCDGKEAAIVLGHIVNALESA